LDCVVDLYYKIIIYIAEISKIAKKNNSYTYMTDSFQGWERVWT